MNSCYKANSCEQEPAKDMFVKSEKNFKDYRKCIMDAWFIKGAVFVDMYAASTNESYRKRREIKPKRFACIPKTQKFFWLYPLLTRLI